MLQSDSCFTLYVLISSSKTSSLEEVHSLDLCFSNLRFRVATSSWHLGGRGRMVLLNWQYYPWVTHTSWRAESLSHNLQSCSLVLSGRWPPVVPSLKALAGSLSVPVRSPEPRGRKKWKKKENAINETTLKRGLDLSYDSRHFAQRNTTTKMHAQ